MSRIVRFGVFEADLASGELRKQGVRVPLQEQPFEVLAALLEHPGELVPRDALRERLWGEQTFVDYEHGLHKAINKIRAALGDAAASPRFVETLGRRGYRFIAPVEVVSAPPAASHETLHVAEAPAPEPQHPPRRDTPTGGWTRLLELRPSSWVLAALALAAVLFFALASRRWVDPHAGDTASGAGAGQQVRTTPAAWEAYLLGTSMASRGTEEGFATSVAYFERAIRLDPHFAEAHAELAGSHAMLDYLTEARGPHLERARALVARALELDGELPAAQLRLATVRFYWDWDWLQCDGALRALAGRSPPSAGAALQYANCLEVLGRNDAALRQMRVARAVDPRSPRLAASLARVLQRAGRLDEARSALQTAIDLNPGEADAYLGYVSLTPLCEPLSACSSVLQASVRSMRARVPSAVVDELDRALRAGDDVAFHRARREVLLADVGRLSRVGASEHVPPVRMAGLLAAAGAHDQARQWLERAFAERSPALPSALSSPAFAALRDLPFVTKIAADMRLAP